MLILTVLAGPDEGRRFDLPDDEPQLIGRSSEALPLTDQTISRRHAELTPDDGRWHIRDLRSSNGTYVNGKRVHERTLLHEGDQIRTGSTLFLYGRDPRDQIVHLAGDDEMDANIEQSVAANDDSMIMAVADPTEAAAVNLSAIYKLLEIIGSGMNRLDLLEKLMDLVFEYVKADRGFILLRDSASEEMQPVVVRHRRETPKGKDKKITVSRTIVDYVVRRREGVLSSNAMNDMRFSSGDSVQRYAIRSAMCVPIVFKEELFGVIHLDSEIANYTYTDDQLLLLTAIGVQTGLALSNLRLYSERLQRERLAAIGQTVASLSHSVKNIIQGLRGGAEVVDLGLRKNNMKAVHNGWGVVTRNLDRISQLTMNMLAFSKQRKPDLEMTSITAALTEAVQLVQQQYDAKQVALLLDLDEHVPPVPLDVAGIHQAILNLLNNALDAVEAKTGAVTLSCEYDEHAHAVRITVADNGVGIDPEDARRLFEPFYSTKGLKGTGLGLAVTKKIVEEHGGTIEVDASHEQGTIFTITLPTSRDAAPASSDTAGGPIIDAVIDELDLED